MRNIQGMPPRVPPWVEHLGVAVWVSDPDRRICYLNGQAEELLGVAAENSLGHPCFKVVRGESPFHQPFCGPSCPLLSAVVEGRKIEPYTLRIQDSEQLEHWIQVLGIPVWHEREKPPLLIHCAFRSDRTHRMMEFLKSVAARSSGSTETPRSPDACLTPREKEIIQLLARDETMYSIAGELNLSYVTVRNHVQHILIKLDAHSTLEAVAQFILRDE